MSRSFNEISTPNQRGRVGNKKTKRLSSKQSRKLEDIDSHIDKNFKKEELIG